MPGSGNGCGSPRPSDSPTSTTVPTPSEGSYALWVWIQDAEGNQGPPSARQVVVDRTAPKAPIGVAWANGFATWTDPEETGAPIVRAHWKLCRGWTGSREQCLTGDGPAQQPFPFSPDMIPLGTPPSSCVGSQWTAQFWLQDAAGNIDRASRNAGGTGVAVTPGCAGGSPGSTPDGPASSRTKSSLTISRRLRTTGKGAKRRQRVTLTATAKPRNASGTVRIRVTGKQGKRKLNRTRSVRLSKGRASFTLTVPKGFRKLSVSATYAGSATYAPSSRRSTVRIPKR